MFYINTVEMNNVKEIMDGNTNWVVKELDVDDDHVNDSISIGSITEDSMNSMCSSSSLDLDIDQEVSSSNSSLSSSSSNLNGPLYELSELMNHLPLKRGLSMFYEGKAQSFGSLARVESIEDLAKEKRPNYRKKVKSCKSFGGRLDSHKILCTPKATISKKVSRGHCVSLITRRRGSFLGESRSSFSVQKKF